MKGLNCAIGAPYSPLFKALALVIAIVFASAPADWAQGFVPERLSVAMDTRFDFTADHMSPGGNPVGFHGRYLNLMLNGNISSTLSFSMRQRLNKFANLGNDVFSATDWIELKYRPVHQFSVAGGKQVLLMGGFEYDAAPIDVLFSSNFWNNINCYQFGASATYHSDADNHALTLQMTNSPFTGMKDGCYAFNLYWTGHMGALHTIWSANLMEYMPRHYATYLVLGNEVHVGPVRLRADLLNGAAPKQKFWFSNYSFNSKAEWDATSWLTVMAKGGYDRLRFSVDPEGVYTMMPNGADVVEHPFYGGGLMFYPMRGSRDLRLHAICSQFYENDGTRVTRFSVGLKWKLSLYTKK